MANVMGFPSPPQTQQNDFLQKLLAGLVGRPQSYGGALSAEDQKAQQQQAMLALGSGLLAGSGPSPVKQSFGSILGPSLMAAQQARAQTGEQQLQALLMQSQIQKNGQKERGKLVPAIGPDGKPVYKFEADAEGMTPYEQAYKDDTPAALKIHEAVKAMNPEDRKLFFETQRSPVTDRLAMVNGVPTWANPITHSQTPMSTLDSEADAARRLKEAEASGAAFGKASGEISAGLLKKGADAKNVQGLLEGADALIDVATGSKVGATRDAFYAAFGYAPQSAQAAAELKLLEANLMLQQPRMEGPQSNMDQQLYRDMAGQIGNPQVPADIKKAALRKILELQQKYVTRAESVAPPGASPPANNAIRKYNPATGKIE